MTLIQPLENHLIEMMGWFSCEQELKEWAGPNFRYPYDLLSFIEDLELRALNSFVLVSQDSEFLAFGQYYQRLDKCHLGRLIVNPKYRGKGIASKLMELICNLGLNKLGLNECSLFVLSNNDYAIKAYEKFGFRFTDYPDEISLDNCLYMVKS